MVKASGVGPSRVAGFAGLAMCGSVWSCPVCSAKIAAKRQDDLSRAITHWQSLGGKVLLVTLTERHRAGQSLRELWEGQSYAWGAVTSGRAWKADQAYWGVAGWVRVVEVTHGANGWHVHVHALLFVDPSALFADTYTADGLGCAMFARWRDALSRKGLQAPLARSGGLDARMLAGDASPLADYFTKGVYRRPADDAAWEVAGGSGKAARRGNRTPFEILRDVVELGDADDLDLWHEWERVSCGKRQMTWSKGIRGFLLLPPELTDDEIVAADELAGDVIAILPAALWRVWRRSAWLILDAAELDDDGTQLVALLAGPAPPGR